LHLVGHQLRIILTMHGHTNIKIPSLSSIRTKFQEDKPFRHHCSCTSKEERITACLTMLYQMRDTDTSTIR